MELLSPNTSLMMRRSMEFLWTKQSCILDNVANVETPGYKRKYVTFEESLRGALQSCTDGVAPVQAMREAIEEGAVEIREADESARMDDNGVNITEQFVELSRTAYQLQYVMDSINSDFSMLRTAIRG